MGRIKAFPSFLALVNARHRSPVNAIVLATAITIGVTLGLGFGYDPVTAFYMVAPARTAAWRGGVHPGMV